MQEVDVSFTFRLAFKGKLEKDVFTGLLSLNSTADKYSVFLKIFWGKDSKSSFLGFIQALSDRIVKLNAIHVDSIKDERYVKINFSKSEFLGFSSSLNTENTAILTISEVTLVKKIIKSRKNNHYFYLTDSSHELMQGTFSEFSSIGKWVDKSERPNKILFDLNYQFTYHYRKIGTFSKKISEITLKRDSVLVIAGKPKISELRDKVDFLLNFASFFLSESVSIYCSRIYYLGKDYITIRSVTNKSNRNLSLSTSYRFFDEFMDSISSIEKLYENRDFWKTIIQKFIFAVNTLTGESRFLVMYNVLEQLFSYLRKIGEISSGRAGSFFISNRKTLKLLTRKYIDGVSLLLKPEDAKRFKKQHEKLLFLEHIVKDKEETQDKIQVLLNKLNVEIEEAGIKDLYSEVIEIRNQLVHPGKEEFAVNWQNTNLKLRLLVNLCILKIFNKENQLSPLLNKPT